MIVGPNPPLALSERMQDAWIAFVRTGNPNTPGLPEWKRYGPEARITMIFNEYCKVEIDPRKDVREFFSSFKE